MSDVTAKIVTPQPPPDTRRVVLEMPYDVAVTLRGLLAHVAGRLGSYRDHTESISDALDDEGIVWVRGRIVKEGQGGLWSNTIPTTSTE